MFEDSVNGDLAEARHTQKLIFRCFIYIDGEILRVAFGPGFFRVGIEGQIAGFVENNIGFAKAISSQKEIDLVEAMLADERGVERREVRVDRGLSISK